MNIEELSDSLSKTSKNIMLKEPFYGFFLIMLDKRWTDEVPTLGVGKFGINYQLLINPGYWESLSEDHRIGALQHELNHIAFRHIGLAKNYPDKKVFQIASDLEVNQYINENYLPEKAVTLKTFPELSDKLKVKDGAVNYYSIIKELADKKEQEGSSGCPNLDSLLDGDNDHKSWENFENLSNAEENLMERQVNSVLQQAKESTEKSRGTVPGHMEGFITFEEIVPPKFDWKAYIRKFVGYSNRVYMKKTRMKENIKFPDQPSYKIKSKQHMLLAIDTSGLKLGIIKKL
jgi:predicted metal-dependent peptidase